MNLAEIWQEFQSYDGTGSKNFSIPGCRVKFYKGAMEIPLIAFNPEKPFELSDSLMKDFSRLLSSFGLDLDCVEEGSNYKINRAEDGQYIGRITQESIKLHAVRIKELGWDPFNKMVSFHLKNLEASQESRSSL